MTRNSKLQDYTKVFDNNDQTYKTKDSKQFKLKQI